eukprot:TRINITY_DN1493_c0_g1_i1.p1 TRINITY_DN1493_c0_g1~~TRINITY_DN1493_c0_g1_i1.p1  ORF type:complete len:250 (+),score=87.36 TRINITY_DN1493_c0_g1_i1:26-775(+)
MCIRDRYQRRVRERDLSFFSFVASTIWNPKETSVDPNAVYTQYQAPPKSTSADKKKTIQIEENLGLLSEKERNEVLRMRDDPKIRKVGEVLAQNVESWKEQFKAQEKGSSVSRTQIKEVLNLIPSAVRNVLVGAIQERAERGEKWDEKEYEEILKAIKERFEVMHEKGFGEEQRRGLERGEEFVDPRITIERMNRELQDQEEDEEEEEAGRVGEEEERKSEAETAAEALLKEQEKKSLFESLKKTIRKP